MQLIPWSKVDLKVKLVCCAQFLKELKAIDPTMSCEDVTQAIFKTVMCREQMKHVHESGIKIGYNCSIRETVFHPPDKAPARPRARESKEYRGPTRWVDYVADLERAHEEVASELASMPEEDVAYKNAHQTNAHSVSRSRSVSPRSRSASRGGVIPQINLTLA